MDKCQLILIILINDENSKTGSKLVRLALQFVRPLQFGLGSTTVWALQFGKRVGKLEPAVSGHEASLAYGPGQKGTLKCFVAVDAVYPENHALDHKLTFAVVKWDAQKWKEWDIPLNRMQEGKIYSGDDINRMNKTYGPDVRLRSFWHTVHVDYLDAER